MSSGFYKRRRGILEHLENGTIGLLDLAIHDYLCLKINAIRGSECSIPAGVVFTSSAAIYAVCPREVSERTVRRSLEHLDKIGWIKRWTTPGKHGNYPVLVARASVHDLSGNEYRVNAEATTDWRFPVYVSGEESASTRRGGGRGLSANREERVENREERKGPPPNKKLSQDHAPAASSEWEKLRLEKNPAPKKLAPFTQRFQSFVSFAFQSFQAKHGRKPLWQTKDYSALAKLLKTFSADALPLDHLKTLWNHFTASTEVFTSRQGDSLSYFASNIDKFADGPITVAQGKANGKSTATDLALRNARALGLDGPVN